MRDRDRDNRFLLNRRDFMKVGGGAVAAAALGHLSGCGSDWLPAPFQPDAMRSSGGLLEATFDCRFAGGTLGSQAVNTRTFNGKFPGPTLRVRAGDRISLAFNNLLPANTDPGEPDDINMPHQFNTTNLHTHGLHVSPAGISDNVLREIVPGEKAQIAVDIPSDHPEGTYWYHPHKHGSVTLQLYGGMAGALIIEGETDRVPEILAAQDIVMVLQEIRINAQGQTPNFSFPDFIEANSRTKVTVNGQVNPTIFMRPGEVQRWRFVQAMATNFAFLSLDGHKLHQIAQDGVTFPQVQTVDKLLVTTGGRADVLVKAGDPGTYMLRKEKDCDLFQLLMIEGPIATVVVQGEPVDMRLPTRLPTPAALRPIQDSEITGRRLVVFNVVFLPSGEIDFVIDGKKFDPNRVDQKIRLGAVEEWTVANASEFAHPFHIHTNPFLVTSIDGIPLNPPRWLDTVHLPPKGVDQCGNARGSGTVVFRIRFTDYPGRTVLHCHLLDHEDMGMMQLIEIS